MDDVPDDLRSLIRDAAWGVALVLFFLACFGAVVYEVVRMARTLLEWVR